MIQGWAPASGSVGALQTPFVHVPPLQFVAQLPQWSGSVRSADSQPSPGVQSPKFSAQVKAHALPVQAGTAFAAGGQIEQVAPQAFTSLSAAQVVPHAW